MRSWTGTVAVLAVAGVVAFGGADAWAPVPPRDCGILKVGGKRYNIKSDQIRCWRARRYARRYLVERRRPRGYTCRNYGRDTRIKFRCWKGGRVFFAIRR